MADIFNILNNPVANLPKEGFDLSQYAPYSMKLGMVVPIGYVHTVPGSNYKIDFQELCHTEPFKTDAFVNLKKHIEVFFCPYSMLWRPSSEFFGQSDDKQSSYEQGHAYVPNISLGKLLSLIVQSMNQPQTPNPAYLKYYDMMGYLMYENSLRMMDMLGFGAFPLWKMSAENISALINQYNSKRVNIFPLLAYQKYWNVYLRDTQHTSPLSPSAFNLDKVPCTSEATSHIEDYYSDEELCEILKIRYRKSKRDLFNSSLVSRQFGAVEVVSLDFSTVAAAASVTGDPDDYVGVIPEGAYSKVTDSVNTAYHPLGGADNYQVSAHLNANGEGVLYPVNGGDSTHLDTENTLRHRHGLGGVGVKGLTNPHLTTSIPSLTGSGSFDVYTLLTAQMMQKWREQIQRAGNKTDSRLRAIYGQSPKSDAVNSPYIIGSTSYDILAQQVTSTSEGANTKLGDIAAKGMGYSQRNQFDFQATEFGVIMAVTYLLPENNYLAPIDKLNTLIEPFDFYVPQLQNLGLEAIQHIHKESVRYNPTTDSYEPVPDAELNAIDGYAARYWYYKTKPNIVHLGFGHGMSNEIWVPSKRNYFARVITIPTLVTNAKYYVHPDEFDTVFGTQSDYKIDTDQFIVSGYCRCYAVQPMSELGLPRW